MTLAQTIATYAANEFINFNAQHMHIQDKLKCWQQVYDTTLAALAYMEVKLQEQHREAMAYVSAN